MLADGYDEQIGESRQITNPERGPPIIGRAVSSSCDLVTAQFRVTLNQKERMKRFWRDEIGNGTKPFLIPDQTLDGAILHLSDGQVFPTQDGTRIAILRWWRVLPGTNTPSFRPLQRGMRFAASFPLLILP